VRTWQLVLILILGVFVSATFLRLNNIGMIQRREAVVSADKSGDAAVLQNRLLDLQRYAAAHMNADTGIIYLQESFNRAWRAIQDNAEQQNAAGGDNIYKKIEDEVCGPQARANGWRWPNANYIACQRNELAKYPESQKLINQVNPPNKELYRHDFIAPMWSPDFAGFSVLFCLLLIVVIIARFIGVVILRIMLHHHYKRA
jgi:hypothetical protein